MTTSFASLRVLAVMGAGALLAPAALAQNTSPPDTGEDTAAQTTAEGSQANAASVDDETVIVVTAQGRRQQLADVPVAISAVNAETLQNSGATDIRQLNQVAPSLLVSSTGSEANGSARIRGIGTVGDNPGLESSVAVFIDGVYRSRSGIGLNELGEIDRIEVLRGPQGTLGGRNSSAGLISIVSKKPSFEFGANGEATYGNYNFLRLAGGVTGPLSETIAARLDGVYVKRDGFYEDPTNNTRVNNRDRYFLRGQVLFEPSSDVSFRLIGDYSKRDESCCGATYVGPSVNPFIGNLNTPAPRAASGALLNSDTNNNIVNVLNDLGQSLGALNQGYARTLSVSRGRGYGGRTEDWGVSGQLDWDFGDVRLTSITAYRSYDSRQASDTDYSSVDILYSGENSGRRFRTFTQELRLQGEAFNGSLDWLVGGFFADEKLTATSDLRFGSQYGRFASCRIVSGSFAALYSPTTPGCISPTGRAVLSGLVPGVPSPLGPAGPAFIAAFDRLESINDRGSIRDVYRQESRNYALFTHNIFRVTDRLDVTLGLRYTNERKNLAADFTNDNTACPAQQAALTPFFATALNALARGLIGLSCQGNSTSELNGVSISDRRREDKFTGTAILSYRPTDDLMVYASFSRGYKAGGFNLDRSALKAPVATFASRGGAQALVGNLQFDPEIVDAYEIGAKYATGPFSLSAAVFRQQFRNFQLNTFDGTVFIVQNVNGCSSDLGNADIDQSKFPGGANYVPPQNNAGTDNAALTGACPAGNVTYGVRSQGVELEASLVPARQLMFNLGLTYADTGYRSNLVGKANGDALNPALRKLPGDNLSNAPLITATASAAWTPDIGTSGLSALFYVDGRMTGDYNTGSDLFPQKEQDGYALFNARVGIRGPEQRWAIELWGQNIFNTQYAQVAFNSPFQEGATSNTAAFADPQYPGGRQLFSQFLAEPRTYGITGRFRF
jgi:iron complex outermembrane recepter protein